VIGRHWLALALAAAPALAQMPAPPPQAPVSRPATGAPAAARPAPAKVAPAGPGYNDLKFPADRPLPAIQPVRFQLADGMKVLLLEDHERPMVTAEALVRTGGVFEPADRAGLAALTGVLIRTGGTAKKAPETVDAELDALGATVDSAIGENTGIVSLSVLKENLAEGLALYRDVLTAPDFRHDRVDRAKAFALGAIPRRNDDPAPALLREFRTVLYGKDSPFTHRPEYATIGKIRRPDVVAFYRRYFFPANVTLSIAGDFDPAVMKGALESLFGGWKNDQPAIPEFPKTAPPPVPGAYIAQALTARETTFAIGLTVPESSLQESAALRVVVSLLGGGFHGRLVRRTAEDLRVVRDVRADWMEAAGRPGAFLISGVCRSNSAADVTQWAFEEVRRLGTTEVPDEELRAARELALTRLMTGMDNRAYALSALARAEYFGYPAGYLPSLYAAVGAVTKADVLRVAKERLQPDKLTVVALSNLVAWTKPLDPRGGAAKMVDLSIPQAVAETTAVEPGAVEIAKKLLARAQQASGGLNKLLAIKDYTQRAEYDMADGSRESQTDRWLAPSFLRQDAQTRLGPIYRYTDGSTGWLSNGRASTALTGAQAKEAQAEILRTYVRMLVSDRLPGRVVAALDDETVEISQGSIRLQVVFDQETGLPAKMMYEAYRVPPVMMQEEYSDFHDVDGIKIPFGITVTQNGSKYSTGKFTEFKINQGLKLEVLQRRP
jgi:zinc protease